MSISFINSRISNIPSIENRLQRQRRRLNQQLLLLMTPEQQRSSSQSSPPSQRPNKTARLKNGEQRLRRILTHMHRWWKKRSAWILIQFRLLLFPLKVLKKARPSPMHPSEERSLRMFVLERGSSRFTIAFLFNYLGDFFLFRCVWLYAWLGCVSLVFTGM